MFFSHLSFAITSLVDEKSNLGAFRTFVQFALVWVCLFQLPPGILEGLRLGSGLRHNDGFFVKKAKEKSRECHNHKPQPFPDIKRQGKPTKLNKHRECHNHKIRVREMSRECHNHKIMVREMSRECHNHKPQPPSQTPRGKGNRKKQQQTNKKQKQAQIEQTYKKH